MNQKISMSKNARRTLIRRIARLSLYAVPFYPVFKTAQAIRRTAGLALSGWHQRRARLTDARKNLRTLTFRQALARRPADALPLEAIRRDRWMRSRTALFFGVLSLHFL